MRRYSKRRNGKRVKVKRVTNGVFHYRSGKPLYQAKLECGHSAVGVKSKIKASKVMICPLCTPKEQAPTVNVPKGYALISKRKLAMLMKGNSDASSS